MQCRHEKRAAWLRRQTSVGRNQATASALNTLIVRTLQSADVGLDDFGS
jgi:hypothetical protein